MRNGMAGGLAAAVMLAGCGSGGEPSAASPPQSVVSTPDPRSPKAPHVRVEDMDLYDVPVADSPSAAERGAAASRFVECDNGISQGGWGPDFGTPEQGEPEPGSALSAFLADGLFAIPDDGYAIAGRDEGRVLLTYAADDEEKVAVIVARADGQVELTADDGWVVETFAACDPAEFDPAADGDFINGVWNDRTGERALTSTITSMRGAEHCGWETVTFLVFDGRQYVRDPSGVFAAPTVQPYGANATLPETATDSGYRKDGRELWLSADGEVAYLVAPDVIEAWPSTVEKTWCR